MNGLINTSSNSTMSWVWTNSPFHLHTHRTRCLASCAAGPQQRSGTAEPIPVAGIWGWSAGRGSLWWHWHLRWRCSCSEPLPRAGWCRSSAARGNVFLCSAWQRDFSLGVSALQVALEAFPGEHLTPPSVFFYCWQPLPGSL